MMKRVDIEAEEKKVENQTKIVRNIAILFLLCVVVVIALFLWEQYQDTLSLSDKAAKSCGPGLLCMTLNEWGDFFAGSGATIALIFISWGLFLQTKELSLQRLEMRATRQEQEETNIELAKSRTEETSRALLEHARTQIEIQPVLEFTIQFSEMPDLREQDDLISLKILSGNNNLCRITNIEIVSPEVLKTKILVNSYVPKTAAGITKIINFDPGTFKNFPLGEPIIFSVSYADSLEYVRTTTLKTDRENIVLDIEPDPELITIIRERSKYLSYLRDAMKEVLT